MSRHSRMVGLKETPGYRWEIAITAALVLITLGLLLLRPKSNSHKLEESSGSADTSAVASGTSSEIRSERSRRISRPATPPTAEEIVANRLAQFGRSRREIVRAIARRSNRDVPPEVERFFDALETGRWEEIDAAFNAMAKRSGQYEGYRRTRQSWTSSGRPCWMRTAQPNRRISGQRKSCWTMVRLSSVHCAQAWST